MLRCPLFACVLLLGCGASPTEAPADAARDVSPELDAPGAGEVGEEEAGEVDAGPEVARDASPEASTDGGRDAGPELEDTAPLDAARALDAPSDTGALDARAFDAAKTICGVDLSWCGGRCVDPRSDPRNCGACGRVCASGRCFEFFCL